MSLFPGRSKIYGGKTEGAQSLLNNQNEKERIPHQE